ncbi:MAG: ATP-dependent helicase [Patescibacteria group bacterium]|nr:ATP-dependent helicase [Patescibacteria group bacterium]
MFNRNQQRAVEYNQGPLLIIAGPGTGKTTVIIKKINFLIKNNLAKPEEILALTFTEKAALEMEEKVDQELPYGYFQMVIDTFHGFADQVLRNEIIHLGLSNNYQLMSEAEALIFFKKNLSLFELSLYQPIGNPTKYVKELLDHFSRLRDENISPVDYLNWVKKNKRLTREEKRRYQELAQAYDKFQHLKLEKNLFDFADLIFYLIKLFRERPSILNQYQQKFKYILIDEFQDTNVAQYELIKLLKPPGRNSLLCVVGDDSQAIYKFRGASVSNILSFMNDYPEAEKINLIKNYRSNQTILDKSYRLIRVNDPDTLEAKLGISKKLIAINKKTPEEPVDFFLATTEEEEAEFVVEKILSLRKKNGYQYRDFAILCRANNHANTFTKALEIKGIPYQFLGPSFLFKQPEIKDLIAYLKFLADVFDSISLFRVLSMKIFDIDPIDLKLLIDFANKINRSLFETMEIYLGSFDRKYFKEDSEKYYQFLPLIRRQTKESLIKIFDLLKRGLTLLKNHSVVEILYDFLEKSGYLRLLSQYKTEIEEKIALNISKFFRRLKSFELANPAYSIAEVVEFLELSMEIGDSPLAEITDLSSVDAVNILTVHSAKGLEFPVVFVVNLTYGRFPSKNRKELIPIPEELIKEILPQGNPHLQEERRLFYVAMTRAKNHLYLSASKFYGEGKRQQKVSPFVIEIFDQDYLENKYFAKKRQSFSHLISDQKIDSKVFPQREANEVFSHTQLEIYERCPLQYKYTYVLQLPTPKSASLNFGEIIHKTLFDFYSLFKKERNVGEKEMLALYQKNWQPVGFLSKKHESDYFKRGKQMLIDYLKKHHHKDINISYLEMNFKIKFESQFIVRGKIDRVDIFDQKKIEVIDYKTGKKPEDDKLEKDFQLAIYGLALKELLKKDYSQILLSYLFLETQEKVSLSINSSELELLKKNVVEKIRKIITRDFTPKPGFHCDFCPFRIICEAWS